MIEPCNRSHWLNSAKLPVIKVGSAVLTNAHGLDLSVIGSLANQLAAIRLAHPGRQIIVVSSGAVAAGRVLLAASSQSVSTSTQTARQALAAIGQGFLIQAWTSAFQPHGLQTAQILLTRDDFRIRERFQHATNTFVELLSWNTVPIINENDTVSVDELQFGDNDCLASLLVNLVQADLFVNLTSAPGVLGENPERNPQAEILECIPHIEELNLDELCGTKTAVGSGGMYSKLLAARRVAQLGVPTIILPGREPDILLKAFGLKETAGPVGTWISPGRSPIPRRKFWLAYQSIPQGTLSIDAGATEALLNAGRSLLPGGITMVEGSFNKGDLVRILHEDKIIGVGFSNYGSEDLKKVIGLKRHEIAAILGNARYPDVIHRDNLLIDAAI